MGTNLRQDAGYEKYWKKSLWDWDALISIGGMWDTCSFEIDSGMQDLNCK